MKHASVVLVVDGRYALQLRDGNTPVFPNTWGLFGGGVEPHENPQQAAVREIREELELEIAAPRHLMNMDGVAIFVADVTEQWPRHKLHEGARAGLFHLHCATALGLNQVTEAALRAAEAVR